MNTYKFITFAGFVSNEACSQIFIYGAVFTLCLNVNREGFRTPYVVV